MTTRDPAHADLVKRFFLWAHANNLRPSIKALDARPAREPGWHLSVEWNRREVEIAFEDADTVRAVGYFAAMVERFDPETPPFDPGDDTT